MENKLIDTLIDTLKKETDLYEGIQKLSKNKTDAIVEGKVSELESITSLEQSMILKLGKLEEEREKLVEQIALQLNVKASDITITNLKERFSGEQAEKLNGCHNTLSKLVNELSTANELNSKLIRNSLDYIDFSINLLTDAGSTGNNYGTSGMSSNLKKRNFFDIKL
ncbi:MAG: flagellar protein FlgN [Clostridiaceae bacterium]